MGIPLMLLGTAFGLAEGVLTRSYNRKHTGGGFFFTAIVSLGSMLFFLIYDLVADGGLTFSAQMLPYGLISGILYCSASLLTYIALQIGPYAISMLILSYSGLIKIGYGILFQNEPVSLRLVVGIVLIVISLFLSRGSVNGADRKASAHWLVYILYSACASGMFGVVSRMQQVRFNNEVTNEYMILTLGFSAVILAVIGIIRDKGRCLSILKEGALYAGAAGLANGAANFLGLVINMLVPLSVSVPTRSGMKSVLSFLISLLIFKERFLPRQTISVIIGAIAVVILNLK